MDQSEKVALEARAAYIKKWFSENLVGFYWEVIPEYRIKRYEEELKEIERKLKEL